MSKFLLSAAVLLVSLSAQAQVHIEASFKPVLSESNNSYNTYGGSFSDLSQPNVSPDQTRGIDLRTIFGYAYNNILGGIALNYSQTQQTRGAVQGGLDALDRKISIMEYGLALGYVGEHWRFILSYMLAGEKKASDQLKDSAGTTTFDADYTNKLGSAYQLTVGYSLNLTSSISFSPTLIYRAATYSSQTLNDKITPGNSYTDKAFTTKASESEFVPFFAVTAKF